MRKPSRLMTLVVFVSLGGAIVTSTIVQGAAASGSRQCTVPPLAGTPVAVARVAVPQFGCRLGRIVRRPSISTRLNDVIETTPAAGRYPRHTLVDLVISAGPAAALRSTAISGRGTNDDPYTGSCTDKVDGICRITFNELRLFDLLDSRDVPAYRCPDSDPWLLNKAFSGGRIVPKGVLVDVTKGAIGVTITGISVKEGKTKRVGHKVYVYEYATGTKTGFPNTATAWTNNPTYRISIYCTSNLAKANLINVRG